MKYLWLIFVSSLAFANGPKYNYPSPRGMDDEMHNIYSDITKVAAVASSGSVPSGMIAMFAAACPAGWLRFTALDNAFPYGGSSYGTTGGNNSITLSVAQLPAHNHTITDPGHTHTETAWDGEGGGGPQEWPEMQLTAGQTLSNSQAQTASATTGITQTNNTGSGNSIDIRPSYVTVVWCKKN